MSRGKIISFLMAVAIAFAMQRRGHPRLAVVVLAIAGSLALIALFAPRLGARIDRALARFSGWVGAALSFVLLTASFVLVLIPANLVLRLLGRRPLSLEADARSATYWEPVPASNKLYARTYLLEARRPSGASPLVWCLAGLGAAALLVGANAAWGEYLRRSAELRSVGRELAVERTKPAWQPGLAWLERYLYDSRAAAPKRYVPFVGWRHLDYTGETLHIVDGYRQTTPAGSAADPEIALFGGSALWGVGARDEHTIPSEIAQLLAAQGRPMRVANYGEPGYTLWQDVLLFAQQLSLGKRPRVAAFYDGINDLMVQVSDGPSTAPTHFDAVGLSSQLHEKKLDLLGTLRGNNGLAILLSELRNPVEVAGDYPMPRPTQDYVGPAARDYRGAMALAIALGAQYGVPVVFFWQPTLCTRSPIPKGEVSVRAAMTHLQPQCAAYAALTTAVDKPPLVRLDSVFDQREEAIYIDYVHVNELGNRLVAERMLPELVAAIDAAQKGLP